MPSRPTAIDLFAGAGGMSLGLETAGFDVLGAIEADSHHAETYRRNFSHGRVLEQDIVTVTNNQLHTLASEAGGAIDLLAGGPPCQGFSVMGRRLADDPRNTLISEYARVVETLVPTAFILENVPGLLDKQYLPIINRFVERMKKAGYKTAEPLTLDASDFGVPQRRRRVFLLGIRGRRGLPTVVARSGGPRPNVWEAIGDLPEVDACPELSESDVYMGPLGTPSDYARGLRADGRDGLSGCLRPRHSSTVRERFAATPPGKREPISRFQRLAKEGIAGTLRAGTTYERGKYMAPRPIHPVAPRCITVREAARLQSFPDSFDFHPTRWHGFREVGNSVPPLLAEAVARSVLLRM